MAEINGYLLTEEEEKACVTLVKQLRALKKSKGENTMMINREYANAILTLANKLSERNIPHTLNVIYDGLQIRFPWNYGDLVCHSGSYGHENGEVESMGCPWDDGDVTCISVNNAFKHIVKWYAKNEA